MDCISNAIREGASDVRMLDVYPELPPSGRPENTPWPLPPKRTLTTYALDEGGEREWNAEVIELIGDGGRVARAVARKVEGTSSRDLRPVPGSEFDLPADLVLIAIGFSHPEHEGLVEQLGRRPRRARQRQGAGLRVLGGRGVRLRRRAHRPVAGRDRDRRGPQVRAHGGPPPQRRREQAARPDRPAAPPPTRPSGGAPQGPRTGSPSATTSSPAPAVAIGEPSGGRLLTV